MTMREMHYNKLVRDKIPENIERRGHKTVCRKIIDNKEYLERLSEKLVEEVYEFIKEPNIGEIVDIAEVLDGISAAMGVSQYDFLELKKKKAEENGKFVRRIFLEKVITASKDEEQHSKAADIKDK